jgi:hypothetical protein
MPISDVWDVVGLTKRVNIEDEGLGAIGDVLWSIDLRLIFEEESKSIERNGERTVSQVVWLLMKNRVIEFSVSRAGNFSGMHSALRGTGKVGHSALLVEGR